MRNTIKSYLRSSGLSPPQSTPAYKSHPFSASSQTSLLTSSAINHCLASLIMFVTTYSHARPGKHIFAQNSPPHKVIKAPSENLYLRKEHIARDQSHILVKPCEGPLSKTDYRVTSEAGVLYSQSPAIDITKIANIARYEMRQDCPYSKYIVRPIWASSVGLSLYLAPSAAKL